MKAETGKGEEKRREGRKGAGCGFCGYICGCVGFISFAPPLFFPSLSPSLSAPGVCEGLLYAQKAGLDLTDTIAAVGAGAAGSFSINNLGPRIVRRLLLFLFSFPLCSGASFLCFVEKVSESVLLLI